MTSQFILGQWADLLIIASHGALIVGAVMAYIVVTGRAHD